MRLQTGTAHAAASHVLARSPAPIQEPAAQDRPLEVPTSAQWQRRLAPAILVAAIVGGGSLGISRWLTAERSVDAARLRIAEVTRGSVVRDVIAKGRVVAAVSPTLYAPALGTVTLAIAAGDAVRHGQVLATIASPELENELRSERSTLEQLETQLGSTKIASDRDRLAAQLEADEAELELSTAARELDGLERAFARGALPESEIVQARDRLDGARVRRQNAVQALALSKRSARFDLQTVKKQHERQRLTVAELERRIAELEIRAPVVGVVGTVLVADRAMVPANTPLMTVVDLDRLEVELEIPETYADDLGIGMAVDVRFGTITAAGSLSSLSPEVVDQHVLARVRFTAEQPAGLRQSQRVSARISIDQRPDVVKVPRGPFLETHGNRVVYVVERGVAARRPIRVGVTSVDAVEITEGLAEGERVVIAGSEAFEDAAAVRINP